MRIILPRGIEIRQDSSCPSGQQYWRCTTILTHFAGCCIGDPCESNGICPENASSSSSSTTTNTPTTSATTTTSSKTTIPTCKVTVIETAAPTTDGHLTTVTNPATSTSSSSSNSSTSSDSNNTPPAGIAVGVVALVALIIGAFFLFRKRRRRRDSIPLPVPVEDTLSPTRNSGFFQSLKKLLTVGSPQLSPLPVYQEQEMTEQQIWQGHVELPAPVSQAVTAPMEMPVGEQGRLQGGVGEMGGVGRVVAGGRESGGGGSGGNGGGLGISELPAQVPSRNLVEERSQNVIFFVCNHIVFDR
ncbi:hypothetical protein BDD12DRAFT_807547 [Trichophaea hybrida]|nr:hypothetical protein BDD12DRAFT_807547 [Trichophaea hybrida]